MYVCVIMWQKCSNKFNNADQVFSIHSSAIICNSQAYCATPVFVVTSLFYSRIIIINMGVSIGHLHVYITYCSNPFVYTNKFKQTS